jgi:putative transcriptional regulator
MADDYNLGDGLIAGMTELRDWKAGKVALEVVRVSPMAPAAIKAIRKSVAKSTREFDETFGIPATTVANWEQGRREPDLAARLLLRVIQAAPDVVERVVHEHEA